MIQPAYWILIRIYKGVMEFVIMHPILHTLDITVSVFIVILKVGFDIRLCNASMR